MEPEFAAKIEGELEDELREWCHNTLWLGEERYGMPPLKEGVRKRHQLVWAIQHNCNAQAVGRWISRYKKSLRDQPSQQQKTPEQIAILEAAYARDPLPSPEDKQALIQLTDLTKKQIDAWFGHQRQKDGITGYENLPDMEETQRARESWRRFDESREAQTPSRPRRGAGGLRSYQMARYGPY